MGQSSLPQYCPITLCSEEFDTDFQKCMFSQPNRNKILPGIQTAQKIKRTPINKERRRWRVLANNIKTISISLAIPILKKPKNPDLAITNEPKQYVKSRVREAAGINGS